MPKALSEHEKEQITEAIYKTVLELIKEKDLKSVTVDDVMMSLSMAKGSFYKYYTSKEVCLYEVIKRSENDIFDRLEATLTSSSPSKDVLIKALHEIFLNDDSIALYITPKDAEWLYRKLPPEYAERECKKGKDYFERTILAMGINPAKLDFGVLAHLMDSLVYTASKKDNISQKKTAMELIVNTIADYLMGGIEND